MGHGVSQCAVRVYTTRLVLQRVYLALHPPVLTMSCASDSGDVRGGMDTVSVQPPVPPKVDTHAGCKSPLLPLSTTAAKPPSEAGVVSGPDGLPCSV